MIHLALPMINGAIQLFRHRKIDGVAPEVLQTVLDTFSRDVATNPEMQQLLHEELRRARQHDITTFDRSDRFSNRLRSSVRPLVTFTAMGWYVYARLNAIPLSAEDYAIIGGIMAFWFGFRPFEKRLNTRRGPVS